MEWRSGWSGGVDGMKEWMEWRSGWSGGVDGMKEWMEWRSGWGEREHRHGLYGGLKGGEVGIGLVGGEEDHLSSGCVQRRQLRVETLS